MRRLVIAACLGSALAAGFVLPAAAGSYGYDPHVIPGIGPESGPYGVPPGQQIYDPGVGYVGQPGAPMPRPIAQPQPVARAHNLGGGLLEALMGGSADRHAMPAPAASQSYGAYGRPRTVVAYNSADLQSDPYGAADYAVRPAKAVDPMFQRQRVAFDGAQAAGTIVIDTTHKFLYLVEDHGQALRYGIGVGRPGFVWTGTKTITRKAEWPDWTPPSEMRLRRPDLPGHMDGGIANPLGARAMYLGSTLYRIHGTNEPDTIGTNVSSGCIRLTNEDVSDLYNRVRVGTRVVVL